MSLKRLKITLIAALILTIPTSPLFAECLESFVLVGPHVAPYSDMTDAAYMLDWWASLAFADHVLGITLTFCCLFLTFCLIALNQQGNLEQQEDGGSLGRAKIKEGKKVLRGSMLWDGESEPKDRGIVYGFEAGKYLYEPGMHVFIEGSTGSFKSRGILIESIDLLTFPGEGQHNILVTDPKLELFALTGEELQRRGYKVLLLDLRNPKQSNSINIIEGVNRLVDRGEIDKAAMQADSIAATFYPKPQTGDAHWEESAASLFSAAILYVAMSEECPREARNLSAVVELLLAGTEGEGQDPAEKLKALFKSLPRQNPARIRASQLFSAKDRELSSILSTLKRGIQLYASGALGELLSGDDIQLAELFSEKTALFIRVSNTTGAAVYNNILTIFLEMFYAAADDECSRSGGSLPRAFTIVGDEFGNLPLKHLSMLPSLVSLGRSMRLYWAGALQSTSMLAEAGKNYKETILANCGVSIALRLGSAEDREYFSTLVGKTTRHTEGRSQSSNAGGIGSSSTSHSEQADYVIRPWEWTDMSPDVDGAIVCKMAGIGLPKSHSGNFKTRLVDATKTPTKKHFGLGTKEHEQAKRAAYIAQFGEAIAANKKEVAFWEPKWPKVQESANVSDDWDEIV